MNGDGADGPVTETPAPVIRRRVDVDPYTGARVVVTSPADYAAWERWYRADPFRDAARPVFVPWR